MEELDQPPARPPPPPPPQRIRPKITLQIPDASSLPMRGPPTAPMYWGQPRYQTRPPGTAGSHLSGPQGAPYINPFLYQSKASEFMFKQFAGFKDFTMDAAKSGLSVGEKTAFWFFNKLRTLSKRWFTHISLVLCLLLYSVMGAGIFMALEGPQHPKQEVVNITVLRRDMALKLHEKFMENSYNHVDLENIVVMIEGELELYESKYTNASVKAKSWDFWNAMFYAGTIYTTIGN